MLSAIALGAAACRSGSGGAAPSASTSAAYSLQVDDADVPHLLESYRRATGQDLSVRKAVADQVACVRISVHVASDSLATVDRALDDALGDKGLEVRETGGVHYVQRRRGASPPCPELAPSVFPKPSPVDPDPGAGDVVGQIERLSDDRVRIPRSALERALLDGARQVRVIPETRDGGVRGIRIFGIRPGSIASAVGLQNGDTLLRVDGIDLGSPEKALEAYAKLRSVDELVIELDRHGTPHTLRIEVGPASPSPVPMSVPSSPMSTPGSAPAPSSHP